ncbi:unnamed protein product [Malus baccata var. baccata]
MAQTPYSLLLLKRLSRCSQNPKPPPVLLSLLKPFSTSPTPISSADQKPSSLSARLSSAWHESKKSQIDPELGMGVGNQSGNDAHLVDSVSVSTGPLRVEKPVVAKQEVEVVHPWPEWIELMERLVQQNYFDHRRVDEDRMVQDIGFDPSEADFPAEEDARGIDFKDFKAVHTACLNFGKDRFDIIRYLSRQDIQVLVGFGCPSTDKKVVFSSKLLRKHTHLDEGDVCSSCSLRNSCERAYLITNKEDEARTIDIMRVLLTYGFDPVNGSLVNKSLLKQKSVKTGPNQKPPPKVKQPPPPPRRRVGLDDFEMKKGDWRCSKCDFMNFAKNNICLQCDAKRPKRQLLPGEWECPGCNFLNYRRNMACFHCDCKRPLDEYLENKVQEVRRGPRTRMGKTAVLHGDANAWNFNFDDNESDGADVAAFEYADSSVRDENSLGNQAQGQDFGHRENNLSKDSRVPRGNNEEYSDDASIDFSEFEGSESEDIENSRSRGRGRTTPGPSKRLSFDLDQNFGARRGRSNNLDSKRKGFQGRGNFDMEDDSVSGSESDNGFQSHKNRPRRNKEKNFKGRGGPNFTRETQFESNGMKGGRRNSSNDDFDRSTRGSRGNNRGLRGNDFDGPRMSNRGSDTRSFNSPRREGFGNGRGRNSFNDDFDRSARGSCSNNKGYRGNDFDGRRMSNRGDDAHKFKGPRREGFGKQQRGRVNEYGRDKDRGPEEFRNSRRVIER